MIFITLGSQKFQFNRLIKAVDDLVAKGAITEPVFAQIGYSDYEPENFLFEKFLDREKFAETMKKSDIVITHGGTGAIIGAVKLGKKVIAVSRRAQYGEHVDDHQLQITGQFRELQLINVCNDTELLGEALTEIRNTVFKSYQSNTNRILTSLVEFIES